MKKLLFALSVSLFACVGQANASPVSSTQTFTFTGTCTDCTGTASATLLLSDYTLGTQIQQSNFVSFTYDGTNLLPGYTITAADDFYIFGAINGPLPGAEDVLIDGISPMIFMSTSNGGWCAGADCGADYGTNGVWSTDVPEPATIALLGSSVVSLAAARRRRRQ